MSFGAVQADLYRREGMKDRKGIMRRRASTVVALWASGRLGTSEVLPESGTETKQGGETVPCLLLLLGSVPFPVT